MISRLNFKMLVLISCRDASKFLVPLQTLVSAASSLRTLFYASELNSFKKRILPPPQLRAANMTQTEVDHSPQDYEDGGAGGPGAPTPLAALEVSQACSEKERMLTAI